MKKNIPKYFIILLLVTEHFFAFGQVSIRQDTNFQKLLKEGRKTNKRIFLLFCTEWCGPCKELENNYFKDSSLAAYLKANYIIGKYDAEKKSGIPIAGKYGILQYPTAVVIDAEARYYYKFIGITIDAASYLATLKYYDSLFSKPVLGISNKVRLDFPSFYRSFFSDKFKKMPDSILVNGYLYMQNNLTTEVPWRILNIFTYNSIHDQYILDHFKEFENLYGSEAHQKVNAIIENSIKKASINKNKADFLAIIKFMEAHHFQDQRVFETKIKFHLQFQDYSSTFEKLLKDYFNKYDKSLIATCDSLFFKKNIEPLDEIILEKLHIKVANDSNPIWNLYIGLFKEKKSGLKEALPYYSLYLEKTIGDNKKLEKLIVFRDKLQDN